MVGGILSGLTLKLRDVLRKLGRHIRSIGIMLDRVIDQFVEIRKIPASHIR